MKTVGKNKYLSIAYSRKGFSLVELLITVGLMSIVGLAMGTMVFNVSKQNKSLSQKLEAIELEQNLIRLLGEDGSCECMFKGINWDSGNAIVLNDGLKKGCGGSKLIEIGNPIYQGGTGLKVKNISLTNASLATATPPTADLVIELDSLGEGVALKPIKISSQPFVLTAAGVVDKCLGTANPAAICSSLGGALVNGKCVMAPNLACSSLGGTWSGSKCNIAAAQQPQQPQQPQLPQLPPQQPQLPDCIYQTIGTAAGVSCPQNPDPGWCKPWGSYSSMTSVSGVCTVYCKDNTPLNGPKNVNCK